MGNSGKGWREGQGKSVAGGGERERAVCVRLHMHTGTYVGVCVWDREKQETDGHEK